MNAPARETSWLRTIQVVLWSFVGLRKNSESQQDIEKLSPFHIIGVAIGMALLFVLGLIALVNWVVAQPTGLNPTSFISNKTEQESQ